MILASIVIAIILAYAIGSIPTGLIIGKLACGIDIREHGSGNIGSTNILRILGWKAGISVLVLDIAKGAIPCLLMMLFWNLFVGVESQFSWEYQLGLALCMATAVLGHMFSPFLKFKGGKGIATSFGGLVAVLPICAACALAVFLIVVLLSRYVSLGSLIGTFAYAATAMFFYNYSIIFMIFGWLVFILIVFAHRKNIIRLAKGEESKFSVGSKEKLMEED
jgi:glycerol-3-phosphate acyltransferase PlsY